MHTHCNNVHYQSAGSKSAAAAPTYLSESEYPVSVYYTNNY